MMYRFTITSLITKPTKTVKSCFLLFDECLKSRSIAEFFYALHNQTNEHLYFSFSVKLLRLLFLFKACIGNDSGLVYLLNMYLD